MWFSATVLSFLETLPNSPQGINKKARIENWERRKVVGKKGVSFEYSFKSLPQERDYPDPWHRSALDKCTVRQRSRTGEADRTRLW
ncbi:DNA-binding protein [Aggregatibacter actinomycetemcomitans]|uniref:DNA-binding protein n=1 Tax=Aggregatibacter actinomycetemcomitans TaxID=714 RepID=UPI0039C06242